MWAQTSLGTDSTPSLFVAGYWLPIAISLLALIFAVLSFWWMNWRPAKLNVGNLRQFAAEKASEGGYEHNVVIITLPLTLWNSGARSLVIKDFKLTPIGGSELDELLFERVDTPLTTSILERDNKIQSDFFYLPAALRSNEVIQANFVFQTRNVEHYFTATQYEFWLKARFTNRSRWKKTKKIRLDFAHLSEIELLNLNELYSVFHYRIERSAE